MTMRRGSLRKTLGANVRRERMARAWSQEQLGEAANLSQVYISRVEGAKVAASIDVLENLARAFRLEPAELLKPRTSD